MIQFKLKKVSLLKFQILLFIKKDTKMLLLLMQILIKIIKIFVRELNQNIQVLLIKKMKNKQLFGILLLIKQLILKINFTFIIFVHFYL